MNRVDCGECDNFIPEKLYDTADMFSEVMEKAKCKLGKRVMFRKPKEPYPYLGEWGYIRYCDDFKPLNNKYK